MYGKTGEPVTSDETLLAQTAEGNSTALEELLARHQAKIYGLALRMLRNSHDAEEVLQEVALILFQKAGTFRGQSAVSSWIYRITVNASLMKLRRSPKVKTLPLEEELVFKMDEIGRPLESVTDWTRLPRQELERKELMQKIEAAADELPPDYRAVFLLRDVEGLSAEETREILGLSLSALKSRLHRARLFLRKRLADHVHLS